MVTAFPFKARGKRPSQRICTGPWFLLSLASSVSALRTDRACVRARGFGLGFQLDFFSSNASQPDAETTRAQLNNLVRVIALPGAWRQARYLLGLLKTNDPIKLVPGWELEIVVGGHRGLLRSRSTSVLLAQKTPRPDAYALTHKNASLKCVGY